MLNKFISKSPLGATLAAASLLLTVSPNARRITRNAAVKGIGSILSLTDKIKEMTSTIRFQLSSMVEEAKNPQEHEKVNFNSEIEPDKPFVENQNLSSMNVLNDEFLKKQIDQLPPSPHS